MLLSFRVANHRSIRDEQQLLLTPAYEADRPAGASWPAVPVTGIFGANAAGKSNVLHALDYMRSMVVNSLKEAEPDGGVKRRPFCLDSTFAQRGSSFAVDLMLRGDRYTYGFTVDDHRVLDEWLYRYRSTPRYSAGRKHVLFEREGDRFSLAKELGEPGVSVSAITDANVLFLSVAARSRQTTLMPIFSWFSQLNCLVHRRVPMAATSSRLMDILEDERHRRWVFDFVRAADLGITDIKVVRPQEHQLRRLYETLLAERESGMADESGFADSPRHFRAFLRPVGIDQPRLLFAHRGDLGEGDLPAEDQSRGTLALLHLAGHAAVCVEKGAVLAVDELDESLHPLLSARLIGQFQSVKTNPRGAQLLFTSHDATLLGKLHGADVLRRDQVWFVEKDGCGASQLFPLSDFKPRQEENRERRYLNGSYGAVPVLPSELFEQALNTRGDWPSGPTQD